MMVTQQATNGTESIEPDTDGDGVWLMARGYKPKRQTSTQAWRT
jgi:hypothetical protein